MWDWVGLGIAEYFHFPWFPHVFFLSAVVSSSAIDVCIFLPSSCSCLVRSWVILSGRILSSTLCQSSNLVSLCTWHWVTPSIDRYNSHSWFYHSQFYRTPSSWGYITYLEGIVINQSANYYGLKLVKFII